MPPKPRRSREALGSVSLKQLAAHIGLSQPTVSRVINGFATTHRISPATQKRVLDAPRRSITGRMSLLADCAAIAVSPPASSFRKSAKATRPRCWEELKTRCYRVVSFISL